MKRDKLDRKLAEFNRLYKNFYEKSFELKKTEVLRIEQEIRNIVGNDPDFLDSIILMERREDLLFLLDNDNFRYREARSHSKIIVTSYPVQVEQILQSFH